MVGLATLTRLAADALRRVRRRASAIGALSASIAPSVAPAALAAWDSTSASGGTATKRNSGGPSNDGTAAQASPHVVAAPQADASAPTAPPAPPPPSADNPDAAGTQPSADRTSIDGGQRRKLSIDRSQPRAQALTSPGSFRELEKRVREDTRPNGWHFLCAEDDRLSQIVITKTLQKAGVRVTLTANGAEAVEAFKADSYDAVLTGEQGRHGDNLLNDPRTP